jgi:hypothetical protein
VKNLRFACASFVIGLLAAALTGCGSSVMSTGHTQSGSPPAVSGVGLQGNGSAANRWLYVQFNEQMDPATINSKTITVTDSSGAAVPGNVDYFANYDTAGFQPNPALQENSTYTMTVATGVASAQGVPLAKAYTDTFTTRSTTDESPIYVKSVSPSPNATCVSAAAPITITLSEGADISTLTSANITITGPDNTTIPAKIGYNVGTATVTLTPNAALPTGTIMVKVSNVADAAGVKMTQPYAWSFSTECNGGSGGTTTQYTAPLFNQKSPFGINGQVTIDTTGNTTIQLNGAGSSTTYTAQFCPAIGSAQYANTSCFDVTTISTDSSGNGSATVKFPKTGDWAGDFMLNDSAGNTDYETGLHPGVNNETYMSTLVPESKTNNGLLPSSVPQDPLTSGSLSYSNGSLTIMVTGGLSNTKYLVGWSETIYVYTSSEEGLPSFATDPTGNGGETTTLSGFSGDMFAVGPAGYAGYFGGFSVPQ